MQDRPNRGRWVRITMLALGLVVMVSGLSFGWLRTYRPEDRLRLGWKAYAESHWDTASVLARERLKQSSGDREALRLLARSSIQLGRDSTAMVIYEQLGSSAMLAEDLYLLGVSLGRTGNRQGSIEVWQQALKAEPDHPATLYEMTQVYLRADRFHSAAAAASHLAQHSTWKDQADVLMGQIELKRENPGKAGELWQQVLGASPLLLEGSKHPW